MVSFMLHSVCSRCSCHRCFASRGCAPQEIGIVLAVSTAIRVFAGPAVGHVADRLRQHTTTLCACSLLAAVAGLGYVMIQGFAGLLVVALVQASMACCQWKTSCSFFQSTTTFKNSERKIVYGWMIGSTL